MRCRERLHIALLSLLFLAACERELPSLVDAPAPDPKPVEPVTVMTFNVENLFDTRDDPGKDDRTYLPLAMKQTEEHRAACAEVENEHWRDQCLNWDWSDDILARKLSIVADVILQVGGGLGPDIVALQEIENLAVLERLSNHYLGNARYRSILIEGADERGIDVAFLSRLPLVKPAILHAIEFGAVEDAREADTRGILEATFRLPDGSLLTGYAVHFPAPFHPTGMRIEAYEALNGLLASLPDDRPAFAAGDFNTTLAENREQAMLERFVRPSWVVAHESGCNLCRGTSYYARTGEWSFLDMILWSPAAAGGAETTWQLHADSTAVANAVPAQSTPEGWPARFALPEGSGVSDHWPLVVTLELK
jgi:endonuclease/exonuclease/phosphatase family metal-dependent hydrolase